MPRSEDLVAIVLGAGRGRRMGGPKALMDVAGAPWWRVQQSLLDAAGVDCVWTLSPDVAAVVRMQPDAPQRIIETDADAPMFDSVLAGLRACAVSSPRGVFILPIDCPAPAAEVWTCLAEAGPVSAPAVAGVDGHPVYLDWSWTLAHIVNASLPSEKRRLDALTRPVRQVVEVEDPSVTVNMNTPEDRQSWCAHFGEARLRRMIGGEIREP